MIRSTFAIGVAAALAGCAPSAMWTRPDTSLAEYDRDLAQCQYEAASATANYGSGQNTARTYGGAIGQGIGIGIGRAMESNNLVAMCLRARGYAQRTYDETAIARAAADPTRKGATAPANAPSPAAAPPPSPARVAAAPAVGASVSGESRWMLQAEGVAKVENCSPPAAAMTSKGAGMELFAVACPNGTTLAIRCEIEGCRVLR